MIKAQQLVTLQHGKNRNIALYSKSFIDTTDIHFQGCFILSNLSVSFVLLSSNTLSLVGFLCSEVCLWMPQAVTTVSSWIQLIWSSFSSKTEFLTIQSGMGKNILNLNFTCLLICTEVSLLFDYYVFHREQLHFLLMNSKNKYANLMLSAREVKHSSN